MPYFVLNQRSQKISDWFITLHPKVTLERSKDRIAKHSFGLQKMEVQFFPLADVFRWTHFIENLQKNKELPKPFYLVELLVNKYLKQSESTNPVLDVGCETGKNALCLIQGGQTVALLDIAPNAIQYTIENLKKKLMDHGIVDTITGKIEDLGLHHGPFKAVIGTYAFSFISPELFKEIMKKNILDRVETNGYFAGGFFGSEHAWAKDTNMTFFSVKTLKEFFKSTEFSVIEIMEKKEESSTVLNGQQFFHTIDVIAKKTTIPDQVEPKEKTTPLF